MGERAAAHELVERGAEGARVAQQLQQRRRSYHVYHNGRWWQLGGACACTGLVRHAGGSRQTFALLEWHGGLGAGGGGATCGPEARRAAAAAAARGDEEELDDADDAGEVSSGKITRRQHPSIDDGSQLKVERRVSCGRWPSACASAESVRRRCTACCTRIQRHSRACSSCPQPSSSRLMRASTQRFSRSGRRDHPRAPPGTRTRQAAEGRPLAATTCAAPWPPPVRQTRTSRSLQPSPRPLQPPQPHPWPRYTRCGCARCSRCSRARCSCCTQCSCARCSVHRAIIHLADDRLITRRPPGRGPLAGSRR